jgi:hypothetical protein
MAADVFILGTTHQRLPSGLIVPGNGEIVAVVGTEATDFIARTMQDYPEASIGDSEAGVLLQMDVFAAAALDTVISLGYATPTLRGQHLLKGMGSRQP